MSKNKFPNIYCCSLIQSEDRRENIKNQFLKNNISSFRVLLSEKFEDTKDIVEGEYIKYIDDGTKGAIISHLRMIKHWYYSTNEPYGFFCEDDLSMETVQYWNFTWNDFIDRLPNDWDCIQLVCASKYCDNIKLRRRQWDDFSVGAYIITRKYAKVLIDSYIGENKFILEYPEKYFWAPLAENLIYYSPKSIENSKELVYNVYVLPLFVEEIKFTSTFFNRNLKNWGEDIGIYKETHKEEHIDSHYKVLNWWKTVGKDLTIGEIINL